MPYAALTEKRRRRRPDADIRTVAREWSGRWVIGGSIEAWLRRHLVEMSLLMSDHDWSWQDLADTLNEAGITYAGGRPWTADRLCNKAGRARSQLKARAEKSGISMGQPVPPVQSVVPGYEAVPPVKTFELPVFDPEEDGRPVEREPEFKVATLRGWSRPSPPALLPQESAPSKRPNPQPASAPEVDVNAVLAEFLARPRYGAVPMPKPFEPEDD